MKSKGQERVYTGKDRAPAGKVKIPVEAPSVFKPSGWTRRFMALPELFDAYDLQVRTQKELEAHLGNTDDDPLESPLMASLVSATPEKLTHHLVKSVLKGETIQDMCGDDLEKEQLLEEEDWSDHYHSEGVEWLVHEKDHAQLNDEHVARNDDLRADIMQWDSYIVNHYAPQEECKEMQDVYGNMNKDCKTHVIPMICVGGEVTEAHIRLFEGLRKIMLRSAKRRLVRSLVKYLVHTYGQDWKALTKSTKEVERDVTIGRDAIVRFGESTWWDWAGGSTLHFWRWPTKFKKSARDGLPVRRTGRLWPYLKKQSWPKDSKEKKQMTDKIKKVIHRGYISAGPVQSLTGFFPVPKGQSDIRLVYDASKCGLNDTIWAPSFWLPTIDTTLAQVPINGYMADIDLGEMFLNFPLDEKIRSLTGVDVTEVAEELKLTNRDAPPEDKKFWL